jgi:tetratricopeptide (TPR) repeat protein
MASHSRRAGVLMLAVAWLGPLGCAGMLPGRGEESPQETFELPSADATAPAEYDILLAHEFELDGRPEPAKVAYQRALAKDPQALYVLKRLADLSAQASDLDAAARYGERALALAPEEDGVRLFLGTIYRLQDQPDAALRVLSAPGGDPIDPDAAMLLYGALADAGRFEESERAALWLLDAEPDGMRGTLALADVYERMGRPHQAEKVLREGLRRDPEQLAYYGALALTRRKHGDREGELDVYREILVRRPGHHATLLSKAEAELALGRMDDAVETLEEVEARYPSDLRTVLRLAFLDYEANRFEAAAMRFEHALGAQREQYEVAYFLGVTQRQMGAEDDALATFDTIPADHDRYPDARVQVAGIYEGRGDIGEALDQLEKARAAEPSRPLDFYRANLMAKSGDVAGAIAFLETLLVGTSEDAEVIYNMGVVEGEAGESEAAIGTMLRVLELDPDHAGALNYVGYTWAEQGENLDDAERMIARALEQRPDDGYIMDSLGWVYYMRARPLVDDGQYAEAELWIARALTELERAAEITGGDPVISEHLGDAYLLKGDKAAALRFYEEALDHEPREGEQPELRGKVERLRGELGAR